MHETCMMNTLFYELWCLIAFQFINIRELGLVGIGRFLNNTSYTVADG